MNIIGADRCIRPGEEGPLENRSSRQNRNQAPWLRKLGYDGDKLKPCYMNVKSADADNREGIAARIYWSELFGAEFYRSREGSPPNNLLNYGYTILRAAVGPCDHGLRTVPSIRDPSIGIVTTPFRWPMT